MIRNQVSILCVLLLCWCGIVQAAGQPSPPKPTIQEQVSMMAAGSVVEVKMLNKQKLRGRLGEITATGFEIQYAVKDKIDTRTLEFSNVKSIKEIRKEGMGRGGLIALSMLAGLGILVLVTWIVCVAGGCYD